MSLMDNISLYKKMVYIRGFQEKLIEFVNKKIIKIPLHLSIGQEAIGVGISAILSKKDHMYGNHRSIGHYLSKGGNPNKLLWELLGNKEGCSGGVGGGMHLTDKECGFMATSSIVGGTIGIAVGDALIQKISGTGHMVIVIFGEGACNEGILYESINFSVLHKLPIVFVCENNGYATHKKIGDHLGNTKVYKIFQGLNINCCKCNGNDIVSVINLMKKIKGEIKSGKGPYFIEVITYRTNGHVTVGKDVDFLGRTREEVQLRKKKCPIKKLKRDILTQYSQQEINQIQKNIRNNIDSLFDFTYQNSSKKGQKQ